MIEGSKELKITLVGGHTFLAGVQLGADPQIQARNLLTYGVTEAQADGSCTIHPLARISSVVVQDHGTGVRQGKILEAAPESEPH